MTLGRRAGNLFEVESGLFDGDRVVTQRANQLYAQSLRGGSQPAKDHEETNAAPASSPQPAMPWWAVIAAGGAIMAGTFAAGMVWANRRNRKTFAPISKGHIPHESLNDLSLTDYDAGTPTPALKSEGDRSS